jgi:hypothetical protein
MLASRASWRPRPPAAREDEYLVISDQGQLTLAEDVVRFGRYSGTGARSLPSLARQLAGILAAVHQRGVVSRDVAPKNVIVDTIKSA